jgi:dihydroorotate dehydrogenase (fumarate)
MDLSTNYLGLKLRSPIVASSSPLCRDVMNIARMQEAGVSAVVLHSLFEEQIELESQDLDRYLSYGTDSFAESLNYFPELGDYNVGPHDYLEHIRKVKAAVTIPIIASLNGNSPGGWTRYAKLMEEAGADAIELNLYTVPTNPEFSGEELEVFYGEVVTEVRARVKIPLAVKLSPFFTSLPNIARRLEMAGASAAVLFNRFYQPDFDIEALELRPHLMLSTSEELLPRLHAIAILHGQTRLDLAVTGGVHNERDVLKSMMAGAKIAMMTSCLLQRGIEHAKTIESRLVDWMEEHEYSSIQQMQGSMSFQSAENPEVLSRINYMKVLGQYSVRNPLWRTQ